MCRIVPLELTTVYRSRLFTTPFTLAVQIYVYYLLWTAAFRRTASAGGLDVHQTVAYATLALLIGRIRLTTRFGHKDAVPQRVRDGTIGYWFLRPISPSRYYMYRSIGNTCYGTAWAAAGYVVVRSAGIVGAPSSGRVAALCGATFLLGQVIQYYIGLIIELSTFWIIDNGALTWMTYFLQDLLSGVFVPLWLMPGWLLASASALPFASIVNLPVSVYVGRIAPGRAVVDLTHQLGWVLALAVLTRFLWTRAERRVTSQGG